MRTFRHPKCLYVYLSVISYFQQRQNQRDTLLSGEKLFKTINNPFKWNENCREKVFKVRKSMKMILVSVEEFKNEKYSNGPVEILNTYA